MNSVAALRSVDLVLTQRDPQLDGLILEKILNGWPKLSIRGVTKHERYLRASQMFSKGDVVAILQMAIGMLPASLTNAALSKFYKFQRKVNVARCHQCRTYINYYSRIDLTNKRIGINEILGNNTYIHQKGCSCPQRWRMPLPNTRLYIIGSKAFLIATRDISPVEQLVIEPHPRQLGEKQSIPYRSLRPRTPPRKLVGIDIINEDDVNDLTTSCDFNESQNEAFAFKIVMEELTAKFNLLTHSSG